MNTSHSDNGHCRASESFCNGIAFITTIYNSKGLYFPTFLNKEQHSKLEKKTEIHKQLPVVCTL